MIYLRLVDRFDRFFTIFDKEDKFCDSCLLFLHQSPSEKVFTPKEKNFAQKGSKIFPFSVQVDLFLEAAPPHPAPPMKVYTP